MAIKSQKQLLVSERRKIINIMAETERTNFALQTELNGEQLAINNFESVNNQIAEIIQTHPVFIIQNEYDKKLAKDTRARLNNVVKQIDRERIDSVRALTSLFEEQCNALKSPLQALSKDFDRVIKNYEELTKIESPIKEFKKSATLTIKFNDDATLKKVLSILDENGCEYKVSIKGE